jgi:hypothetical protein
MKNLSTIKWILLSLMLSACGADSSKKDKAQTSSVSFTTSSLSSTLVAPASSTSSQSLLTSSSSQVFLSSQSSVSSQLSISSQASIVVSSAVSSSRRRSSSSISFSSRASSVSQSSRSLAQSSVQSSSVSSIVSGESCPADESILLCDDFESGASLDLNKWELSESFGGLLPNPPTHIEIDKNIAHSGNQSVRLRFGGEYGYQGIRVFQNKMGFKAPNDEIYLRAYMRFASVNYPNDSHPYFISAVGKQDRYNIFGNQVGFGEIWGELSSNVFSLVEPGESGNSVDFGLDWTDSRKVIKAGEWFCIQIRAYGDHQFENDPDHSSEEFRVAINGVDIPDLLLNDATLGEWFPAHEGGLEEHWSPYYDGSFWRIGFASIASDEIAMEYWVDDVVFSTRPVSCME